MAGAIQAQPRGREARWAGRRRSTGVCTPLFFIAANRKKAGQGEVLDEKFHRRIC